MPGPVSGPQSVKVTFKFVGLGKYFRQMDVAGDKVVAATIRSAGMEMKRILDVAKSNTPVDTRRLQDSGRMFKPRFNKGKKVITIKVLFGGITVRGRFVDYASIVHETHKTKPQFLGNAVKQAVPGLEGRIVDEVNRILRV